MVVPKQEERKKRRAANHGRALGRGNLRLQISFWKHLSVPNSSSFANLKARRCRGTEGLSVTEGLNVCRSLSGECAEEQMLRKWA